MPLDTLIQMQDYRDNGSWLTNFLREEIILHSSLWYEGLQGVAVTDTECEAVDIKTLYDAFEKWCNRNDRPPGNVKNFQRHLRRLSTLCRRQSG